MDGEDIIAYSSYLTGTGNGLTAEELSGVAASLPVLKKQTKSQGVLFWGKILGLKKDILLAQTYGQDIQRDRKNYYSLDGVTWGLLPKVTPEISARSARIHERFSGELSHEYRLFEKAPAPAEGEKPAEGEGEGEGEQEAAPADGEGEEGEGAVKAAFDPTADDEDMPVERKVAPKVTVVLREEERVAAVMQAIHGDCFIIPRGAYYLSATHQVAKNKNFNGLPAHGAYAATELSSYVHQTEATRFLKKTLLEREGLSRTLDFLDDCAGDKPAGTWSMQYDSATSCMSLRNLSWPGHCFTHRVESASHGCVYIGTGQVNRDVCFML